MRTPLYYGRMERGIILLSRTSIESIVFHLCPLSRWRTNRALFLLIFVLVL
jgi:hypothetical protein